MRTRRVPTILLTLSIVAATVVLITTGPAEAYTIRKCPAYPPVRYDSSTLTFRGAAASYPASSPWRRFNWIDAQTKWDRTPGALDMRTNTWDDTSVGRKNDQNETWFSDSDSYLDGKPAKNFYRWWCGGILETDVVFNANKSWYWDNTGTDVLEQMDYGGVRFNFQRVAMHELGHAFGLLHNNYNYNVMGGSKGFLLRNGSASQAYVGEDGARGQVRLYGTSSNAPVSNEDVSVSHWRYGGADGEYSLHAQTRVLQNGAVVPSHWSPGNGMNKFDVRRGLNYVFEFTLENNGASTQNVKVSYVLSTDNQIDPGDRLLAVANHTLEFYTPITVSQSLKIPADINAGPVYYVGVILDVNDSIWEWNETNNATFQPVTVIS